MCVSVCALVSFPFSLLSPASRSDVAILCQLYIVVAVVCVCVCVRALL